MLSARVGVLLRKRVAGVRARPMEATPLAAMVAGLVATTRAHADAATQEYATAATATPTTRSLGQDINRVALINPVDRLPTKSSYNQNLERSIHCSWCVLTS